jgi:Transcriptional regulator containing an amidase domain and an AraC-type DNA-binding HTH domain
MGRSIFHIEKLGGVLERVLERVMIIPRGRRLLTGNDQPKIVLLLEGQVRAFINHTEIGEMLPGDALVVPGTCRQAYVPALSRREMRMRVLLVIFRRGVFAYDENLARAVPVAGVQPDDSPDDFVRVHFGSVQLRRGVLTPAVAESINALRREAEERETGHHLRAAAHTLLLISEIARREATDAPPPAQAMSRAAWQVEQVKHFLLEHHTEALTLEKVARHANLSAEHLARLFRKETGMTVFGYIEHLRLERARAQLAGSSMTVAAIARAAGFSSASQFCRTFRRVTGDTPLGYRLKRAREAAFSPSILEEVLV